MYIVRGVSGNLPRVCRVRVIRCDIVRGDTVLSTFAVGQPSCPSDNSHHPISVLHSPVYTVAVCTCVHMRLSLSLSLSLCACACVRACVHACVCVFAA